MIMLVSCKIDSHSLEIFEDFKKGDEYAFKHFFDLYFPPLLQFVRGYTGDLEGAEEIVSDSFIALYEKRSSIQDLGQISGFLYVLARNRAIDWLRKQPRKMLVHEEAPFPTVYMEVSEQEQLHADLMNRIMETIPRLSRRERDVVELIFLKGLTVRDIAVKLQLREQSVRNLRNKALQYLRKKMKRAFE
jgi:RNA polymerase sigma factor (sigma-70 family)